MSQQSLPLFEAASLETHMKSHGNDCGFRERKMCSKPTKHLPGTWDKVEVLAARVQAGEPLWHPEDAKLKKRRVGWESEDVAL